MCRLRRRGFGFVVATQLFRIFVADPGHYTWWDMKTGARARNLGWRIDCFFVSDELRGRIKGAGIMPDVTGSDHCPITLEIE